MATLADWLILGCYYSILVLLTVYGLHRFHLVRLQRRLRREIAAPLSPEGVRKPHVAIQLPVFNEPNVVERLIDAASRIEYDGPLTIQVLDDSTDHTSAIVGEVIEELRQRGVAIDHIRRSNREGFKAGALAAGMALTDAELFAVFDADFVPPPSILLEMVPHFANEKVGMVQARWGHLNRERSILTRIQAIFLDAHFAIESAARFLDGRFFNFNGTAGIWRREAIETAGGWSASTLTEDLDLSYRAQLRGWQFVFLAHTEVPAELPASIGGFQDQQHRWAKGSIQTARKVLPEILGSSFRPTVKAEALFHLTSNSAYFFTLVLGILLLPALEIRQRLGWNWILVADALLFFSSTVSLMLFYIEGQRLVGKRKPHLIEMLLLLPLGIGMSVRNSTAVLEGLFQRGGYFRRTPKQGTLEKLLPAELPPRWPLVETLLALGLSCGAILLSFSGQYLGLPFVLLFLGGYGFVAGSAARERLRYSWAALSPARRSKRLSSSNYRQ